MTSVTKEQREEERNQRDLQRAVHMKEEKDLQRIPRFTGNS